MKKSNYLIGLSLFLILGVLLVQSCSNTKEKIIEIFPRIANNATLDGLSLPDGTIVEKVDNSTISLTYPKGIELWELNDDGVRKMIKTSYTCTCSGENGCDVFFIKGGYGCGHGSCTGSCTGAYSETNDDDMNKPILNNDNLIFVNLNEKLSPIAKDVDFDELEYMPEVLIHNSKDVLLEYAKEIYGEKYLEAVNYVDKSKAENSSLDDIVLIKMTMYGYKIVYGISVEHMTKELFFENNYTPLGLFKKGKISCSCSSGDSGCKKTWSMGVTYCKGGSCTSCTLSTGHDQN